MTALYLKLLRAGLLLGIVFWLGVYTGSTSMGAPRLSRAVILLGPDGSLPNEVDNLVVDDLCRVRLHTAYMPCGGWAATDSAHPKPRAK